MNTDRELLELAAKAAGYQVEWVRNSGCFYRCEEEIGREQWDPLTGDGDALRLSAELGLNIFHTGCCAYAMPSDGDGEIEIRISYGDVGGKFIATRRAIVRAAAEIGRGMA